MAKNDFDELKKTVFTEIVRTSRSYVLREHVRTDLQRMIVQHISEGNVSSPEDIVALIKAMKAAVAVMETVPFESWKMIVEASQ